VSIGLDLGTTQFRSLRQTGDQLLGRLCRPVYAAIPETPAHRRLLERDRVPYAECEGMLVVIGDAAEEWSQLFRVPLVPLVPDGQLPAHDPLSRQILSLLVDAVLPPASSAGDVCCLTIPGELLPGAAGPERQFFSRLVELRGYRPVVIGQGLAVALSELVDAGFTGIGICLGAVQCEFALVRNGQEQARCTIPWGLAELASEPHAIHAHSPASDAPISSLSGSPQPPVLIDFLVELLLEAGTRIDQHDGFRLVTQPVPLACGGGITTRADFASLWEQAWQRAAWPIQVRGLRLARHPVYTVARGCLIQARLLTPRQTVRAA
jgi:hypothetical protein